MDKSNPVISIVLPVYNGQRYVKDSIASCLNQTLTDFELIIVDDCSQDRTPAIVDEFAQMDTRVKVIRNKQNRKLPASLNVGFTQARGSYHTWTSDDNVYAPTALEEMLSYLQTHQHIDAVYCDYVKIDERTGQTREWIVKEIDYIGRGNPVGACFMYKSEVFDKLNGYDEQLFCVEDYDFWLRAYRSGFRFSPLRKKLYAYRCHENSLTETKREQIRTMTSKLNEHHFKALSGNVETMEPRNTMSCLTASATPFPSPPGNKVAIWGWWQGRNLGDNWIKKTLREFFRGAIFINTTQRDFQKYTFVICGGGGLFIRDVIAPWNGPVQTPFGVLGLGAEFAHADTIACELSRKADFFYLRDEYSVACMKTAPQTRSYDLTFAKPLSANKAPDLNRALFVWRDPGQLLAYPDFKNYIGEVESYAAWREKLSGEFTQIDENDFNTGQCGIEKLISDSGFVISGRYHGVVAAIQKGIPCIGIDLCPKIRSLMREAGIEEYCLKPGETGAIRHMIRKAKKEHLDIRQKQAVFCQKAHTTVLAHINSCVVAVSKRLEQSEPTLGEFIPGMNNNCLSAALG